MNQNEPILSYAPAAQGIAGQIPIVPAAPPFVAPLDVHDESGPKDEADKARWRVLLRQMPDGTTRPFWCRIEKIRLHLEQLTPDERQKVLDAWPDWFKDGIVPQRHVAEMNPEKKK